MLDKLALFAFSTTALILFPAIAATASPAPKPNAELAAASTALNISQADLSAEYAVYLYGARETKAENFSQYLHDEYKIKRNVGLGLLTAGAIVSAGSFLYAASFKTPDRQTCEAAHNDLRGCGDDRYIAIWFGATVGVPAVLIGSFVWASADRSMRALAKETRQAKQKRRDSTGGPKISALPAIDLRQKRGGLSVALHF